MTVDRRKRSIKKIVGVLTDPHPEFVSLVSYPASQTPWKVVKSEDAQAVRAKKAELATRAASSVVDIHQIVFAKSAFKTEEAVSTYMEENGYENFQITENGNHWVVPGRKAEDLEDGLEQITVGKGIEMTLGRLRPARKSAEETRSAPDAAGQQVSQKSIYDISRFASIISDIGYLMAESQYEAEYEGDNSPVPDKLKSWMLSGVAIFKELASEEVDELVTRLTSQKSELDARRASKEQTVATKSDETKTNEPVETQPEAKGEGAPSSAAEASPAPEGSAEPKPEDKPTGTTEAPKTEVTPATEPPAAETTETAPKVAEKSAETPPEAPAKTGNDVADAIALALKGVGDVVAAALAPVTKSLTSLEEKVTKSDERLDKVETATRQTRQSGDNAETSVPSTQKAPEAPADEKARKHAERMHRDRMGL